MKINHPVVMPHTTFDFELLKVRSLMFEVLHQSEGSSWTWNNFTTNLSKEPKNYQKLLFQIKVSSGPTNRRRISKMNTISSLVVFAVLLFCPDFSLSQNDPFKTVVTYLGTDFIMPDGCPPPKCDPNLRECRKEMLDLEKEFNDCLE